MYFPDRGCVHTLLTLYVYATVCDSDRLLRQLFDSIKQGDSADGDGKVVLDPTFDYEWLHEIGSGIDDCPLPHHLSSAEEILSLLQRVTSLITALPRPHAITIARSSSSSFIHQKCLYGRTHEIYQGPNLQNFLRTS